MLNKTFMKGVLVSLIQFEMFYDRRLILHRQKHNNNKQLSKQIHKKFQLDIHSRVPGSSFFISSLI